MQNVYRQIFLSPFFLLGLFLLLLNDLFLKAHFGNFLTGKLSDFAGLFVFPLFFAAFFPNRKSFIYFSTIFIFVFWKSPFSQSLTDLANSLLFFKIGRIIDYTDLVALLVLPLSYFYFKTETLKQNTFPSNFAKRILTSFVVLLSVVAFTATTLVKDRTVSLNGSYNFKLSEDKIESILRGNEKITSLKSRRYKDMFPGDNSTANTDSEVFLIDFSLKQKFCDSQYPKFSFVVEQKKDLTVIRGISVKFECKLYETNSNTENLQNEQKQELDYIFEREVIKKLRQNSSQ